MSEKPLKVSERLRKALPSLSGDERKQLELNILTDGKVTDPILWATLEGVDTIVDGMHRYEIAEAAGIPYKTAKAPASVGTTIAEAELWIWDRALGRRNLLDPAAVRKLRGQMYNRLKRQDSGRGNLKKGPEGQIVPPGDSEAPEGHVDTPKTAAETVAEKAGVTSRTVKRDGAYVEALESCVKPIQLIIENNLANPTASEMKWLAKRDVAVQNAIARSVRTGKKLAQAMAPHKRTRDKRGGGGGKAKISAATLVDTASKKYVGPLARSLSKIAEVNGGEGDQFKRADGGLNETIKGLKEMRKGKR